MYQEDLNNAYSDIGVLYSGDLKSGQVQILNGQKEIGLQTVWILNRIWNPEAWPFEICTKATILSETIWNLDRNVQILNGLVFEWLGPKLYLKL